jgi:hypothetical protein
MNKACVSRITNAHASLSSLKQVALHLSDHSTYQRMRVLIRSHLTPSRAHLHHLDHLYEQAQSASDGHAYNTLQIQDRMCSPGAVVKPLFWSFAPSGGAGKQAFGSPSAIINHQTVADDVSIQCTGHTVSQRILIAHLVDRCQH